MKNKKFWNWVKNDADEGNASDTPTTRTLYLNGVIAEESWYGDEVTPQLFKDELDADNGDIEVWINSVGGDVMAATQIVDSL